MEKEFLFFSGLIAAFGYFAVAAIFAFRGRRSLSNALFTLALFLTGWWSLSLIKGSIIEWERYPDILAVFRDAGWLATLLVFLQQETRRQLLLQKLAFVAAALIVVDLSFSISGWTFINAQGLRLNLATVQLAVSFMGLILVENLLLNLEASRRWSIRLMAIGLTALFAYNIVLRIPQFLGAEPIGAFLAAQPLVYLMVLPLLVVTGVRNNSLKVQVHSSRSIVFHSATLIFAGILLQGTAIAAFYVRSLGGTSATALSIVLAFSGSLAVGGLLSSRTIRSQIRTFINENFYSYKYDYRLEWTKFIQALSQYQEQGAPERALRTLADLLDCPGGALWVRRAGWRQYVPLAAWAFGDSYGPIDAGDAILSDLVDGEAGFVDLSRTDSDRTLALWHRRFPNAWLTVPLHFRGDLIGFALLRKSRAARRLDWEDHKFVGLIAKQLALYLVHEQIAQELADSQQLNEFNSRVAFALHDLKNTIGQLNLMLSNAERFGDDPRFRSDMMATIRHAVDNLQTLMGKLKGSSSPGVALAPKARVDVCAIVARCVDRNRSSGVILENLEGPIYAEIAAPGEFESALEHVVSNALEAGGSGENVRLRVDRQGTKICVRVEDNGPGMSPEFLAHELFRPLRTTKETGLGIGAFQARALMRSLGGDMEVQSTVGQGTAVSLLLPACLEMERGAAS